MNRNRPLLPLFGVLVLWATTGCKPQPTGVGGPLITETVEIKEYHLPPPADDGLTDDNLADKHPLFDPELVDRRQLGKWWINQSEAVIALHTPVLQPDNDAELLQLYPSYAGAIQASKTRKVSYGEQILPSINLVDGKAKQFDDGLYAAIDQAYYRGLNQRMRSHVELVRRIYEKVGPESPAAPFLAAGLKLADQEVAIQDTAARDLLSTRFLSNPVAAKPISFYTWNETLKECWTFMRFFQQRLDDADPMVTAIAEVLAADSQLMADYRQAAEFYSKLTNPLSCLTIADLVATDPAGGKTLSKERIQELRKQKGVAKSGVAFFPPSSSKETVLFDKLFGEGLPPEADLMKALIQRIRSGEVDLAPQENSGWYDYQVYALETLLLAEKGDEHDKLLLTKAYKKRMLEAFKALITKRRETHARQLDMPMAEAMERPEKPMDVTPRLRVEPNPTYFLRTARSYSFLHNFLEATLGGETLTTLHGLRKDGERTQELGSELRSMRDLFYGLYLVSCEDIGMDPALRSDELPDQDHCYGMAADWLTKAFEDQDLAEDTRVSIPIMVDIQRQVTRLWVTLGVRLVRLDTRFATAPRIRPKDSEEPWEPVDPQSLVTTQFLIPVDEFAEVEIPGFVSFSREELRKICDQAKTRDRIIDALEKSAK